MIVGHLSTLAEQIPTTLNFQISFDFLHPKTWMGRSEGRFEIDGTAVWDLIQTYEIEPTPEQQFETHHHHIDFHYIVTREETI